MNDADCPVRGHDHKLTVHKRHVQDGTGEVAWTLACPDGNYRFFVIESVGTLIRMSKPRFGWKD